MNVSSTRYRIHARSALRQYSCNIRYEEIPNLGVTVPPAPSSASMDIGYDSSLERRTSWRERAAAEQRQRQIEDAPHLKIVDSIEAVHNHGDLLSDGEQITAIQSKAGQVISFMCSIECPVCPIAFRWLREPSIPKEALPIQLRRTKKIPRSIRQPHLRHDSGGGRREEAQVSALAVAFRMRLVRIAGQLLH